MVSFDELKEQTDIRLTEEHLGSKSIDGASALIDVGTEASSAAPTLPIQAVSSHQPESLIGATIAGHYQIISCIGEGGMSTVYRAKHVLLDSVRAIKILRIARGGDGKILQRFQQEAKTSFFLAHPNIVRVYDFGIEPSLQQPYLVMDCLDGKPLSVVLQEEVLTQERTVRIITQVCDALEHAQSRGIVHRDIKPANIILSKDESGAEVAQLVDFGIAKLINPEEGNDLTQTGEIFGTPLYMSPEQCLGRTVDDRSDIYSLGCVLFECLSGRPPFQGASPLETLMKHVQEDADIYDVAIPECFQQILSRCLAKDPHERYPHIEILKEDLLALNQTKTPPLKRTISKWAKYVDKRLQNPKTSRVLLVLMLVCILCSMLVMTYKGGQIKEKIVYLEKPHSQPAPQKTPATSVSSAKANRYLPQELFDKMESTNFPKQKIAYILEWKKGHPEFNYYVENELRHWYGSFSERKSAEQMDLILDRMKMDDYTINILSGWNLKTDAKKSIRTFLYWTDTYGDLPSLKAACFIAAGDQYAQLGNLEKARWCYEQVLSPGSGAKAGYQSLARSSVANLSRPR